jgi:hypothetical protein
VEDENITGMTTALRPSDQAIVLEGVQWETYERLDPANR